MARTNKRKKGSKASNKREANGSKKEHKPKAGDRFPHLNPPIGFYNSKLYTKPVPTSEDDMTKEGGINANDSNVNVVSFPVKLDPTGPSDSSNRRFVKIDKLSSFTEASEALQDKIFVHESITTVSEVQNHFNYVKGCLTGDVVHQFASALAEAWEELILQAGEDPSTSPFDTDKQRWCWLTTVPYITPSRDKALKECDTRCHDFKDHVWW